MDPNMMPPGAGGAPPMPGGGGPPVPGGKPATADVMKQTRSILDPAGSIQMGDEGMFEMSIRDFFGEQGIDVDGPMTQFMKFAQEQVENADPMKKAQALAGSQPAQDPLGGGGMPPGAGPGPDAGGGNPLDQLL